MSDPELMPSEPTPEEVQYLEDRLYEHNSGATGIADGQLLAFLSRDESGRIIGGISGNTWGGRGPRPQWLRDALANGKSLQDFAV